MPLDVFDRELGTTQGRIQSAGFIPPEGDFAFVLGRDLSGLFENLNVGDFVEVAQTANFGRVFTADAGLDEFTLATHGLIDGTQIMLKNNAGALPAGLSPNVGYFVISATTNTFQLSTVSGGSAINITDTGTGTHYVSQNIIRFQARMRPPATEPIESDNAAPWALSDGQTLLISVDGSSDQTVTFNTADFLNIATAQDYEVVAVINAQLTAAKASTGGDTVQIASDTIGKGSSVAVTGGTAAAAFSFTGRRWRASIISEVVTKIFQDILPGRTRDRIDLAANVSRVAGSKEFKFRLEVVSF